MKYNYENDCFFDSDKYIDMVKNSDKDIYKLLEWKAKKDKWESERDKQLVVVEFILLFRINFT